MVYKHILVAYDGSELAKAALAQAVSIVQEHPVTKLTVLQVFHFPNILVGEAIFTVPPEVEKEYYENAESSLEEAQKAIEGLPYAKTELRQGSPAATILKAAGEWGCDLIIMGSRGFGGLKELMLGSVSHAIVQKAKATVMIIKGAGPIV